MKPFCKHDYKFVRNIHGDEIIHLRWKRSIWQCNNCNKIKLSDDLNKKVR
jgi:hypothetical protein